MRFLHAADLHLDSPLRSVALRDAALSHRLRAASRAVLRRIVDLAIAHQVDAVLLAGDVFDNGVPDVAARTILAQSVARLGDAGIATVLIRGNHDGLLDPAQYGPISASAILLDAARPTVEIGGAMIHGLSHGGKAELQSFLPRYPAPVAGRINIGLMHCTPDGAAGHDPYGPCAMTDLLDHGYDYWALGHIHKRQEWRRDGTLAVMAGIPQGRHIREGQGGSVTLLDVDGLGVRATAIPVGVVAFREIAVALPADAAQDVQARLARDGLLAAAVPGIATVLRVTLTGPGAQPFAARQDEARRFLATLAEDLDDVHLDRVSVAPGAARASSAAIGDLAALMQDEAAKPGFADAAQRWLGDLRDALPPEVRDALDPGDLEDIVAEGLAAVTARLMLEGDR